MFVVYDVVQIGRVVDLGRDEMHVTRPLAKVDARLHVSIDNVGRNAAYLYQAVVLYEYGVAWKVAMHNGRVTIM